MAGWLEGHHATDNEAWLGFWKKHTGHDGLTYPEAVDQALCFGWIDGVLNRIDDQRHRIRFTPAPPRQQLEQGQRREGGAGSRGKG